MAISFSVGKTSVPDNASDVAGDIDTYLGTLTVTTVYEISIIHLRGFYEVIIIYD